ncbi:DNA polymerase III, subunits gamma and tau [Fibrella aestuarina BUZ 2]|uniref:DNA polymerase III subunit gamma/tau n=1 Tax=Fibrella aestuarina BUZ 2 TaxID=1166018 RepID=I0KA47_9BACT|nr:DNA polymerase III subunit gamma/tau [Fibrella aestuarina]CCH01000.1 DNA polymerase III, subunits gamma and tau [Fibrella aestuarina BUZ 2]
MDNFVVSARKYRPATFDTVVGQGHITTTLKNAIRTNQLASAFLFCGPRGVGKTTCARILAKTINCQNLTPEVEACDQCESCVSFNQSASFNIHELDAASNNSVDDIRNLIDQVRYPPQSGNYKIYIIDEVHMLSAAAFNAFLKTLEEPPSYAIFILATTEKHKILPTILSRCQIFDFNRIQPADIAGHLASIAQKEGVTADGDSLELIAQKADGGLRDALSMFDLNVTFSPDRTLRYREVLDNLHILDYDYYFQLTDLLLTANLPQTLLVLDEILRKGFDTHQFVVGLNRHFRDLLVCKDAATVQLLQVTERVQRQYLDQAARAPLSFLLSGLSIGGQCDMNFKQAKDQRLHVELALMKLASLRDLLNWEALPEPAPSRAAGSGTMPNGVALETNGAAEKKNGGLPPDDSLTATVTDVPSPSPSVPPHTSEPEGGYQATPPVLPPPTTPSLTPPGAARSNGVAKPAIPPLPPRTTAPAAGAPLPVSTKLRSTVGIGAKPQAVETESVVVTGERPSQPFTFDELLATWRAFSALRKQQTDMASEQVILNRDLTLTGTTVRIKLDNHVQADLFTSMLPDLLIYLRQNLQNWQLQVEHVVELVETKKMIYTPQDKYNYLAEKNPALHKLRQALGLEVDY